MNKFFASAFAGAVLAALASFDAQAFPISPSTSVAAAPDVTLVVEGCGIGRHRGPHGRCIADGVVVAPGTVVAPGPVVICPPGTHPGPRDRRCIPN